MSQYSSSRRRRQRTGSNSSIGVRLDPLCEADDPWARFRRVEAQSRLLQFRDDVHCVYVRRNMIAPPMTPLDTKLLTREILLGFWKVHILHHAAEHPLIGQWVLTELRRHGYEISPGTLYPLLKRLERNGWLRSEAAVGEGKRRRRYYHLTKRGAAVLDLLRDTVIELHHEIVEEAREHTAPSGVGLSRKSPPDAKPVARSRASRRSRAKS
jgi:PadR family transcriptional regulator, regulatory protein PadR